MVRFWFEFDLPTHEFTYPAAVLRMGCGCTGYDRADCLQMISARVFEGADLPPVKSEIANIDVSRLDPDHVRPNMGVVSRRGIWFPLGFD
jgi:hypothetical protein